MGKKIIRVGDPTSHGGKVLSSSAPHVKVGGIVVALKGDPCSCPHHGHEPCFIKDGHENHKVNGVPVAYEGCTTTCGAVLQSTVTNFSKA